MPGRITEMGVLTGATAATVDRIEAVDVSDTSMAPTGTNKSLTLSELVLWLNANGIATGTPGVPGAPVVELTQAEYDALVTKDPDTMYVITDGADRTVLTGINPPLVSEGINGDFYIDHVHWLIYGPKAANAWPAGVTLIGPPPGIHQGPTPPADTSLLWADTDEVGIEENVRYLKTVATTPYTAVLSDRGKMLLLDNANPIDFAVPVNATVPYPIGTQLDGVQMGLGKVTVGGTVTVLCSALTKATRARYSAFSLTKLDTDTWLLVGDME